MNIGNIIEIMEYIRENGKTEKTTSGNLQKTFGKDAYSDFSDYCLERKAGFIGYYGGNDSMYVTSKGAVELYRLKGEKSQKLQSWLMILATSVVAISSILQTYTFIYGTTAASKYIEEGRIVIGQMIIFVLAVLILVAVYSESRPHLIRIIRRRKK